MRSSLNAPCRMGVSTRAMSEQRVPLSSGNVARRLLNHLRPVKTRRPAPQRIDPIPAQETPHHIAIVMDGSHRWAASKGLPGLAGHEAGVETFKNTVSLCQSYGIKALTVYAFSMENWQRSSNEVDHLIRLFDRTLATEAEDMCRKGIRLVVAGCRDKLPQSLLKRIEWAENISLDNTSLMVTIAISYGGRQDIAAAARKIAELASKGLIDPEDVDENMLEQFLSTTSVLQSVGPPDLLIRTSGEKRLSNFLLYELAYAELYFTPTCWPDFSEADFQAALLDFAQRKRTFGKKHSVQAAPLKELKSYGNGASDSDSQGGMDQSHDPIEHRGLPGGG